MINDILAYFKMEEYQNELRGHILRPRVSKEISKEVEEAKKENQDVMRELRAHFQIDSVEYAVKNQLPF
jgi:hypothetical protein